MPTILERNAKRLNELFKATARLRFVRATVVGAGVLLQGITVYPRHARDAERIAQRLTRHGAPVDNQIGSPFALFFVLTVVVDALVLAVAALAGKYILDHFSESSVWVKNILFWLLAAGFFVHLAVEIKPFVCHEE
jgi:hypothetical protein